MSTKKESAKTVSSRKESLKDLNARRIVTYLNRRYFALFISHCVTMEETKAQLMDRMAREYLERLPEQTKQNYLAQFKTLTPRQIRYTCRAVDAEL